MFKSLFKKNKSIEFSMPITGTVVAIENAPDEVFSSKMMGDGFCIEPSDGKVYSPVNGKVVSIFPTLHCIGLVDDHDREWLIHFGMDSVKLEGVGFNMHVKANLRVTEGELLFEVDIEKIRPLIPSLITPIVITNLDDQSLTYDFNGVVNSKTKLKLEMN